MDRLAVFDLDGTLWKENSHSDIINKYYNYNAIQIFMSKIFNRITPHRYMKWLNTKFDGIPDDFVSMYNPTVDVRTLQMLENYKISRWNVCIISNAPLRIVKMAERRFGVCGYHAEIGNKSGVLDTLKYDELNVVTDNVSDLDIIKKADKAFVVITEKNRNYFLQYIRNDEGENLILMGSNSIVN